MQMIRDTGTTRCRFENHRQATYQGVSLDVWDMSFTSWECQNGALRPITIRAYAVKPAARSRDVPAVIMAHGLGSYAQLDAAKNLAVLLDMFVVAYSGPGSGSVPANTSEGLGPHANNSYKLFDTVRDVRGSWFWGHAVAAMRAITCLGTRSDVDRDKIGMTGHSGGGVATLLAAGADARIKAALPVSGVLDFATSVASPDCWWRNSLRQAGLTVQHTEFLKLQRDLLDPAMALRNSQAKVMLINGSSDEFFPLTAHLTTYAAIPGTDKRTAISANYDHGCWDSFYETRDQIQGRLGTRMQGGRQLWFRHWLDPNQASSYVPKPPVVEVSAEAGGMRVRVRPDIRARHLRIDVVQIWWSNDQSYSYGGNDLPALGHGEYGKRVTVSLQPDTIYYADVQYSSTVPGEPLQFVVSSVPVVPAGLVPHIRDQGTCR